MVKKNTPARKTLASFRATYDKNVVVPARIKAGLEKLGKDGWEFEVDFIKMCGVSTTDFAKFRDQFADFFVHITNGNHTRRVWAGTKATAHKMREMV